METQLNSNKKDTEIKKKMNRWQQQQCGYEKVHEAVLKRLSPVQELEYLHALFDFFANPPQDARMQSIEYVRAVSSFLTDKENYSLTAPTPVEYMPTACPNCQCDVWELDETHGDRVCLECGVAESSAQVNKKFLPLDRPAPRTPNVYRRSTHFSATLHALVTHRPPPHMVAAVQAECARQRCHIPLLTHQRMCEIMRAVGLRRHYALAPSILAFVQGVKLPHLSINDINELHSLFDRVQVAFNALMPTIDKKRHNFVSYPYLLSECLRRIGRADLAAHLPKLRTPEKQRQQAEIWSALVKVL